jgi:formylglycine-generating enzyme required for sulfatase activity
MLLLAAFLLRGLFAVWAEEGAHTPLMIYKEGGTFTMGSPLSESERSSDEKEHQVTVSAFWIGQYEVTQSEYYAVMGSNPSYYKGENLPVEQITWYDAVKFCNALSLKEGLTPAYTINGATAVWNRNTNGYRLPTEAEWEYACREEIAKIGDLNAKGWHYGNSSKETHPVGQKQPNTLGLYDMHGNVWEWCWDWYDAYPTEEQTDPAGAAFGYYRVMRGGSWANGPQYLRATARNSSLPYNKNRGLGFRLARNAE